MGAPKTKSFVNLKNARPGHTYEGVIKAIQEHKVCPFCPKHLATYHKNPIEINKKYWLATRNMYPYRATKHHLLLIHKKHIEHISEISKAAWAELHQVLKSLSKSKKITGGTALIRFGDTHFTGASVTHLHAHVVQSDPAHPEYEQVKSMPGVIAKVG